MNRFSLRVARPLTHWFSLRVNIPEISKEIYRDNLKYKIQTLAFSTRRLRDESGRKPLSPPNWGGGGVDLVGRNG